MSAQHAIISNVVSELEGVKMLISDVQNSINASPPQLDPACYPPLSQPNFLQPGTGAHGKSSSNILPGISAINSRRPLKQAPLGSSEPWHNVEKRKNRKTQAETLVSQSELESDAEAAIPPP
jgi:hypothetical protein